MDERIEVYNGKMEKTITSFEKELATIRSEYICSGTTYDSDPAVGSFSDQGYLQSNPDV